jgi:hypothetical protein
VSVDGQGKTCTDDGCTLGRAVAPAIALLGASSATSAMTDAQAMPIVHRSIPRRPPSRCVETRMNNPLEVPPT